MFRQNNKGRGQRGQFGQGWKDEGGKGRGGKGRGGHGMDHFGGGYTYQFSGGGRNLFSGETTNEQFSQAGNSQFSQGQMMEFGQMGSAQMGHGGWGDSPFVGQGDDRGPRGGGTGNFRGGTNSNFGQGGFKHKLEHEDYPNRKVGRYTRPGYDELFQPINSYELDSFAGFQARYDQSMGRDPLDFQFGGYHPRACGRRGNRGWDRNERGRGPGRGLRGRDVQRGRGKFKGPSWSKKGKFPKNLNTGTENASNSDMSDEALKHKLSSLIDLLKSSPVPKTGKGAKAEAIDRAMGLLGMKVKFDRKELNSTFSGQTKFTASLHFDRVFLSRGIGNSKKAMRPVVYDLAFSVLQTKSVEEIFNQVDPGVETPECDLPKPEELRVALTTLQEYMKEHTPDDNKMTVIDRMVRESGCELKLEYVDTTLHLGSGVIAHKGSLFLSGTLIAEGKSYRSKDTKLDTFENGYKALASRSADALMEGTDVEGRPTADELEKLGHGTPATTSKISLILPATGLGYNSTLIQKFKALIYGVTNSKLVQSNVVKNIDLLCNRVFLQPICFYSKVPCVDEPTKQTLLCDLYVGGVHIATGKCKSLKPKQPLLFTEISKLWDGSHLMKEIQLDAYNEAYKVLTTKRAKNLMEHHKKLQPGEQPPGTFDRVVKGVEETSNQKDISNPSILDGREKTINDFIVLEQMMYVRDRERNAFAIMMGSATSNGMLMEWQSTENPGDDRAKRHCCKVSLQKKEVGRGNAHSKVLAKIAACYDAMKRLYKTQPVVQCSQRRGTDLLTWEKLKMDAENWTATATGKHDDQLMQEHQSITTAVGKSDQSVEGDQEIGTSTEQFDDQSGNDDQGNARGKEQPDQSTNGDRELVVAAEQPDQSVDGDQKIIVEREPPVQSTDVTTEQPDQTADEDLEIVMETEQPGQTDAAVEQPDKSADDDQEIVMGTEQPDQSTAADQGKSNQSTDRAGLMNYVRHLLEELSKRDDLEEIMFGHQDCPEDVRMAIIELVLEMKMNLIMNTLSLGSIRVGRAIDMKEMLDCLKKHGGRNGRYTLLSESGMDLEKL